MFSTTLTQGEADLVDRTDAVAKRWIGANSSVPLLGSSPAPPPRRDHRQSVAVTRSRTKPPSLSEKVTPLTEKEALCAGQGRSISPSPIAAHSYHRPLCIGSLPNYTANRTFSYWRRG